MHTHTHTHTHTPSHTHTYTHRSIYTFSVDCPCLHGLDVSKWIASLHTVLSCGISLLKSAFFMSSFTHSIQDFLGLPLPAFPTTFTSKHFLTHSFPFRST